MCVWSARNQGGACKALRGGEERARCCMMGRERNRPASELTRACRLLVRGGLPPTPHFYSSSSLLSAIDRPTPVAHPQHSVCLSVCLSVWLVGLAFALLCLCLCLMHFVRFYHTFHFLLSFTLFRPPLHLLLLRLPPLPSSAPLSAAAACAWSGGRSGSATFACSSQGCTTTTTRCVQRRSRTAASRTRTRPPPRPACRATSRRPPCQSSCRLRVCVHAGVGLWVGEKGSRAITIKKRWSPHNEEGNSTRPPPQNPQNTNTRRTCTQIIGQVGMQALQVLRLLRRHPCNPTGQNLLHGLLPQSFQVGS